MSEPQTFDQDPEQEPTVMDLTGELGDLGKNLVGILRAAWERPERQKLQQEIEGGLNELGNALRKEAKAVSESPVSQRIKTEVGDLGNRVRSGQVEARVREELVDALHALNTELEKVSNILATNATSDSEGMEENPIAETPAQVVQEPTTEIVETVSKGKAKAKRQAKPKVIVEEEAAASEQAAPPPEGGTAPAEDSPEAG
jgi:hypothetical protein